MKKLIFFTISCIFIINSAVDRLTACNHHFEPYSDGNVQLNQLSFFTVPEATSGFQAPLIGSYSNNGGNSFLTYAYYSGGYVYHPAQDWNQPTLNGGCNSGCNADECLPVVAAANGLVVYANSNNWGGVVIQHSYKGQTWYTQYGHVRNVSVSIGNIVTKGQIIAKIGRVGTECSHLHFEVRESDHPNPKNGAYWVYGNNGLGNRANVENWYEEPSSFILTHPAYSTQPAQIPTLTTPVQNATNLTGSIRFTWNSSNAIESRIQIIDAANFTGFSTSNGFSGAMTYNGNTGGNQYFDWTNPPSGRTFYWTVRASNNGGTSNFAQYRTFTTQTVTTLTVNPTTHYDVPAAGVSRLATSVTTNASSWNVVSLTSWLSVLKLNNGFVISCQANSGVARNGVVRVTAGNQTRDITVNQLGGTRPPNDEPCGAINITPSSSGSFVTGTTINATTTTNPTNSASCATPANDIWYKFTVPPSGNFTIVTKAGSLSDGIIALYAGSSCTTLSGGTGSLCKDDNTNRTRMPVIPISNFGAYVGRTLYVRVWGYNGAQGTFTIGVLNYYSTTTYNLVSSVSNNSELETAKQDILKISNDSDEPINPLDLFMQKQQNNTIYQKLIVSPNPATHILNVDYQTEVGDEIIQIALYDVIGRRVLNQKEMSNTGENQYQIDVSFLQTGLYTLHLQGKDCILKKKILIQR